jgi:hypothetical protein
MTHLTAHRNAMLGLVGVLAIAGCATQLNAGSHTVSSPAAVSVTAAAAPSSGSGAVAQQVTSIDQQLSSIDGQLAAASAGLSTSEGDPAQ